MNYSLKKMELQNSHFTMMVQCMSLDKYVRQFGVDGVGDFSCANPVLTDFFVHRAIKSEQLRELRTYVIVSNAFDIIGYFTLKAASFTVDNEHVDGTIYRSSFPVVEIFNYALDEKFVDKMNYRGRGLGKFIFYQYILPIVEKVRELIGVQYIVLYAADLSNTGKLIKTYMDYGFKIPDVEESSYINHVDGYDKGCQFMYFVL